MNLSKEFLKKKVQNFKNKLDLIHKLAAKKIERFNSELNKMENFSNVLHAKPVNDDIFKTDINRKHTISNFADLINCDFRKGSISGVSFSSQHRINNKLHQVYNESKTDCIESCERQLIPFKLKKYHSLDEIKNSRQTVILSQDSTDLIRIPNLKKCNHNNVTEKLKNKSLDFSHSDRQQHEENKKLVFKESTATNLSRTRSRSLPSILLPSENIPRCCKKNIL